MTDLLRQEIATAADIVVVKVGTRVLTTPEGTLNEERIAALAEEIHQLMAGGRKVVVVSSGAVGAGMGRIGMRQRPRDLEAFAAISGVRASPHVRRQRPQLQQWPAEPQRVTAVEYRQRRRRG